MRHSRGTVTSVLTQYGLHTVKFTVMFFPLQCANHFIHQVINIQQLQFHRRVIHRVRQIIRKCIAERCHSRVIIRPTPLAKQIREAVHQHLRACLTTIVKEQLLTRLFALAIFRSTKPACKRGLYAATQHHRTCVPVLFQRIQER